MRIKGTNAGNELGTVFQPEGHQCFAQGVSPMGAVGHSSDEQENHPPPSSTWSKGGSECLWKPPEYFSIMRP